MAREALNREEFSIDLKGLAGAALYKFHAQDLDEKIKTQLLKDIKISLQKDKLREKRKELIELQKSSQTEEELHDILKEINGIQKELDQMKSQKSPSL